MPISWKSELMLNQKPADVLAPGVAFDVVQTSDGGAVYLSISTDRTLCMTKELQNTTIGWEHADQSSSLSSNHGGQSVIAKSFVVSQHPRSLAFDVALVVTVDGSDHLYLSSNNPADSVALSRGLNFAAYPFDADGKANNGVQISDVFLMMMPGQQGTAPFQNCFVDVLREPGDPLKLLDRYYINMSATSAGSRWIRHGLPIELAAGSIASCLGQRNRDRVPGIYTFGAIAGKQELIYTPQRNVYRPDAAPNSVSLTLPPGSTSMATSLDKNGCTNLFVAANEGIFLWTADNQGEEASPLQIVVADDHLGLLSGLKELSANTAGGRTQICGLNSQGDLVHMFCPSGSEASPSSWSSPIPLVSEAQAYSFYLDSTTGNTVLFADHVSNGLLQLSENPVTTSWSERRILLPPSNCDNFTEYHSFTTHITVSDESGLPRVDLPDIELTAAAPVSVYINDKYHVISPTAPLRVSTDETGVLTVVQETQNLEAAAFSVTVLGGSSNPPENVELIQPMNKLVQTLSSIKTGEDLGNVQIEADDGTKRPLLDGNVSGEDKRSAAQAIANLVQINTSLPKDGSTKLPSPKALEVSSNSQSLEPVDYPTTWGVSFAKGGVKYVEGEEAMLLLVSGSRKRKRLTNASGPISLGDIGSTIRAKAGAFFRWCKRIWHKVTTFISHEIDGIMHFICTIGEKIYQVALDCYHAVVGALEFVFTHIKVFFQDLVRWLGFIFNWDDVLRTHSVIKKLILRYSENMISQLDNIEGHIEEAFIGLENGLNALTEITDDGETFGTQAKLLQKQPGADLPQARWGLNHAVNGAKMASMPLKLAAPLTDGVMDDVEAALEVLARAVENEAEYLKTTMNQLKTQVMDSIQAQRPVEAMKKILGIVGELFLKSTRNIIVALIDIVKLVVKGMIDTLNMKLHIPVLSWIYGKITGGSELTCLDLLCLIGATAATAIHKIIVHTAPYPDSPQTNALIHAASWESLKKAMTTPVTSFTGASYPGNHGRHHHRHHHNKHGKHGHGAAHHKHKKSRDHDVSDGRLSMTLIDPFDLAQAMTNVFGPVAGLFLMKSIKWDRSWGLCGLTFVAYVVFVSPNFVPAVKNDGDWMTIYNDVNTALCISKTFIDNICWNRPMYMDNVSPLVEYVLNVPWVVPSFGWFVKAAKEGIHVSDFFSLFAAIAGACYGVASGMTAKELGPECNGIGRLGIVSFTGAYGAFSELFSLHFMIQRAKGE